MKNRFQALSAELDDYRREYQNKTRVTKKTNRHFVATKPNRPNILNQIKNEERVLNEKSDAPQSVSQSYQEAMHHDDDLSDAMYGTGEHVLSGENQALLGGRKDLRVHGIPFTYAEIMAMGDLYQDHKQMMKSSTVELKRLQTLIRRSKQYYSARVEQISTGAKNTSDKEWIKTTNGRYLDLAKENFSHFAPSSRAITPGQSSHGKNHKSEWERYHKMAIERARKSKSSNELADALVMNAFGDHFLTDAFAAGHFFNKKDISNIFQSKVISGSSLTNAGKSFVEKVANKVFRGAVKNTFSKYEVTNAHGIDLIVTTWKPNIDTADRFSKLLGKIIEREPDFMGKTVVAKAIHDHLNKHPVMVQNKIGKPWRSTGDGTLNNKNLDIMRQAVGQSISNIYDAPKSNTSINEYYKKVWNFVPQPTASSVTIIKGLISNYTNPTNIKLIDKTVGMINKNYKEIIDELIKRKVLKIA